MQPFHRQSKCWLHCCKAAASRFRVEYAYRLGCLCAFDSAYADGLICCGCCRLAAADGLDIDDPFYRGVPGFLTPPPDGFGRSFFFVSVTEQTAQQGEWGYRHIELFSAYTSM